MPSARIVSLRPAIIPILPAIVKSPSRSFASPAVIVVYSSPKTAWAWDSAAVYSAESAAPNAVISPAVQPSIVPSVWSTRTAANIPTVGPVESVYWSFVKFRAAASSAPTLPARSRLKPASISIWSFASSVTPSAAKPAVP